MGSLVVANPVVLIPSSSSEEPGYFCTGWPSQMSKDSYNMTHVETTRNNMWNNLHAINQTSPVINE